MLESIKRKLKEDVGAARHGEVFRRLRVEVLRPDSKRLNEAILLEGYYNESKSAGNLNLIDHKEKNIDYSKISFALLALIDELKDADIKEGLLTGEVGKHRTIPHFHAFTCDRIEQSDAFEQSRPSFAGDKPAFFYLYGHEYQAHKSFFARLAFEFEHLALEKEHRRKAVQVHLSIKESRDPQVYREILIRDLFVSFGLDPAEHPPLLSKNLRYLVEKSPKIKALQPTDAVFFLAHVSHWSWDKDLTPAAARWFIASFCGGELPADLPMLLFFFSFDYDEEYDADVKAEILVAVAQSDHVQSLPELGMVRKRDVGAWLSAHEALVPGAQARNEILKMHFNGEAFFMENVEKVLTNLIDDYKNQQIR